MPACGGLAQYPALRTGAFRGRSTAPQQDRGTRTGATTVWLPAYSCLAAAYGVEVNHKRVYRLYRAANLAVKRRKRRKGVAVPREPLSLPAQRNEVWSMDFVMDALSHG